MQPNLKPNDDIVLLFKALSTEFAEHAARDGIKVKPYQDENLPHYSKLDPQLQKAAIVYLQNHLNVFREFKNQSKSLLDSPQFVWRALNSLGYVPSSDLFDKIEKDDVIEVYTSNVNQSFRSLNFFRFTDLTLEQICSFPIYELIDFGPAGLAAVMDLAGRLARNEINSTIDPKIPAYLWKEKETATQSACSAYTKIKWVSPARHEDGTMVVVVINGSVSV